MLTDQKLMDLTLTEPTFITVNHNKPLYCSTAVSVDKSDGSCNTIDGPHTQVSVPSKVNNLKVKVLNLM